MSTADSWASTSAVPSCVRVYISSAVRDLREARKVVIDAVRHSGYEPVMMESYGADTRPPLERCLIDVGSCDVYVGIVAWRYGSCPPGERKSFTHLEYDEAVRLRKQILLFHLDENTAWPLTHVDQSRRNVNKLRNEQSRDHIVDHFSTLDQLSTGVRRALHRRYGEAGAQVPELLPYIVDRDAQKDSLDEAFGRGELERSPSVVVLHGATGQAHHKFVEYMQEQLLTRYLGVEPIDRIPIALPSEFYQLDVITRRIARGCRLDPTADIDVLSRQLHDSGLITMLWFPVEVEVCRGRPQARRIVQLVDYFARWPSYRPLRVLAVISAQYREVTQWSGRLPWRAGASPNGFGRAIEQAIAPAMANGGVVVLPELTNVEQVEVEVWSDQAEVRRRLGRHDPVPAIRRIFQEHERSSKKRGMPMETLAKELTQLLQHLSPWQEPV